MDAAKASQTAVVAAFFRAYHHKYDDPKIFDDPFAELLLPDIQLIGNELLARRARGTGVAAPASTDRSVALAELLHEHGGPPTVLARARYAEDHLLEAVGRGVAQYVLVGAGLETFPFRYPELEARLQVFEVDHPATQALKRQALVAAGLALPANLHFVAVNFETMTVADGLADSSFDRDEPSVFSWQGVVVYLTRPAIRTTLRSIRSVAAPGSMLLLSYLDADAFDESKAAPRTRQMMDAARAVGEPFLTGFDPVELRDELAAAGFELVEDIGAEEQQRRYFGNRSDGYRATEHTRFACASVR